jgi:hypothetical protein
VGDVGGFGSGSGTVSLYQQLSFGPSDGCSDLGALLFLFGGVAPVALIAAAAVVRSGLRARAPMILAAAVAAWDLTWIGVLLREATLLGGVSLGVESWIQAHQHRRGDRRDPHGRRRGTPGCARTGHA